MCIKKKDSNVIFSKIFISIGRIIPLRVISML